MKISCKCYYILCIGITKKLLVLFNKKAIMCEKFDLGRWNFKIWISILVLIHGFAEMLAI